MVSSSPLTAHDATAHVPLAAIHGTTAGLEVDASCARIGQSCDELDVQDQIQTTRSLVFVTLHARECVGFAETSENLQHRSRNQNSHLSRSEI